MYICCSLHQPVLLYFVNKFYLKGIRRLQRGRQKSLIQKTNKTMANKVKRKTKIDHTTLVDGLEKNSSIIRKLILMAVCYVSMQFWKIHRLFQRLYLTLIEIYYSKMFAAHEIIICSFRPGIKQKEQTYLGKHNGLQQCS